MKLLITCVPMILRLEQYEEELAKYEVTVPQFTQTMSEENLIDIIGEYDAWIAGDDPVTRKVLLAAKKLKSLVKWGIGIDNVDLQAVQDLDIPFTNTPGMFGNEVADVAIGYLIALTRKLYNIHTQVRKGNWYKPAGISLEGKRVALIGFGDIGRNIADRLLSLKTDVHVYDPGFIASEEGPKCIYADMKIGKRFQEVTIENSLEDTLAQSRILILACAANRDNHHLLNAKSIELLADDCYIVNVSRGSLVSEEAVLKALDIGKINSFATDVFEEEPVSNSKFMNLENVILGSHNSSNTKEAVDKTSLKALKILHLALEK